MKQFISAALLVMAMLWAVAPARAEGKPVQLSLFSPVQVVAPNQSVSGLRLTLLYGRNIEMTGFDLGAVTRTKSDLVGIQMNLVGMVDGTTTGLQFGFGNITGSLTGIQWGAVNVSDVTSGAQFGFANVTAALTGIQWGAVNFADAVNGAQVSCLNLAIGAEKMQCGFGNYAGKIDGLQFGFVNVAGRIHGLQIGLINVVEKGGWFPVLPIINGGR